MPEKTLPYKRDPLYLLFAEFEGPPINLHLTGYDLFHVYPTLKRAPFYANCLIIRARDGYTYSTSPLSCSHLAKYQAF